MISGITNLASKLCEILGCMDQHADVVRTARLAKADLVTQMVYEFPELQELWALNMLKSKEKLKK